MIIKHANTIKAPTKYNALNCCPFRLVTKMPKGMVNVIPSYVIKGPRMTTDHAQQ